jgi:16S rRNA pseudouridine516 synthase
MRRIDQLLANLGYCSRREARDWVKAGRVSVRGVPASDSGQKADPAEVTVDGEPLDHPEGLLLVYHKPTGLVCSHDPREAPLIYDQFPERWRRRNPILTSVGRLDKETSGLLLLTDQTQLVHRLTSPKKELPKVYVATVDKDIPADLGNLFSSGTLKLDGDDKPCAPATLAVLEARRAEITLTEGRYHQVRRMFATQGLTVLTLHRRRFGDLELGDLPSGTWKLLPLNSF